MKERSVSFWWDVAMGWGTSGPRPGRWGPTDEEWYLTTGTPLGPIGYMRQRYQAFEEAPGLFRIFADTLPTQEGILEFASKYGLLTRDNSTYQPGCDRSTAQGKIELPREASNSGEPAIGEGRTVHALDRRDSVNA